VSAEFGVGLSGSFGMARHWKEKLDPSKHRDFMRGYQDAGGLPAEFPHDNLIHAWAYFVEVAGFTFQFVSPVQIREALEHFERKIHPSTREQNNGSEHYWQPWYSRLPPGLNASSKRTKVVRALGSALSEYESET